MTSAPRPRPTALPARAPRTARAARRRGPGGRAVQPLGAVPLLAAPVSRVGLRSGGCALAAACVPRKFFRCSAQGRPLRVLARPSPPQRGLLRPPPHTRGHARVPSLYRGQYGPSHARRSRVPPRAPSVHARREAPRGQALPCWR